ncbi:MAG: hypothetical protein AB1772_03595 [Candidatus Zixiibacteriota bacterium]
MTRLQRFFPLVATIVFGLVSTNSFAVDIDVEATASGGSTSNLFSDSTEKKDTYSTSSVDLNWYPLSVARLNLVSEYSYYGNYFNLSNLVYGGGLTLIPTSDSSRISTYLEGNLRKREYRDIESDSTTLNANEFTGDEYDAIVGIGYRLSSRTQLRAGVSFASTQYNVDGVIDREKLVITAGANTTLFDAYALDLEIGYSTGRYQHIDTITYVGGDPPMPVPRRAILSGEQYSILLTDRLKSLYVSPRLSRSLGRKTGLSLTYSYRQFLDRNDAAIIYGYSSGYLSPWLGEFAGQAAVLKIKTYLIPRLITSISAGFWEREHIRTVERELRPNRLGQLISTVNLRYAQERTDWRRRVDLRLQWPILLGSGVVLEPSLQADYTDNNSIVRVYDYDDFSLSVGATVRF